MVTVIMTVVRSHSCMSRLVTAGGLVFCGRPSRRCFVLGCSRCWALEWSSLIVLRLRHRNRKCYRGSKADSEYGRHLFHRFTYGSTKASGLRAFPENRQRCVWFLACHHGLRRRAALIVGDRNCAVGRGRHAPVRLRSLDVRTSHQDRRQRRSRRRGEPLTRSGQYQRRWAAHKRPKCPLRVIRYRSIRRQYRTMSALTPDR
jgi:hypothetical protein